MSVFFWQRSVCRHLASGSVCVWGGALGAPRDREDGWGASINSSDAVAAPIRQHSSAKPVRPV